MAAEYGTTTVGLAMGTWTSVPDGGIAWRRGVRLGGGLFRAARPGARRPDHGGSPSRVWHPPALVRATQLARVEKPLGDVVGQKPVARGRA